MSHGKKGTKDDPAVPPEKLARLIEALKMGCLVRDACTYSGVSESTFYKYVQLGPSKVEGHPMRAFAEAVAQAQTSAKVHAVGRVSAGMKKDWKAAAWWLGVADPKNYGPKIRVTLEKEFGDAIANLEEDFGDQPELLGKILASITRERGSAGDGPLGVEAAVALSGADPDAP